jgi:hypothetical protein
MNDRIVGLALLAGMGLTAVMAVGMLVFGSTFMDEWWRPLSGTALSCVVVALAVVVVELIRLERGRR